MNKNEMITRYKAAVAVFRKWLETGLISSEEFAIIETITAEKYGLSSCSIYRENVEDSLAILSLLSDRYGDQKEVEAYDYQKCSAIHTTSET